MPERAFRDIARLALVHKDQKPALLLFMDKVVEYHRFGGMSVEDTGAGLKLPVSKDAVSQWPMGNGKRISIPYTVWTGQGPTATRDTAYMYFMPEAIEAAFAEIAAREHDRFCILDGGQYQAPSHQVSLGGHHE